MEKGLQILLLLCIASVAGNTNPMNKPAVKTLTNSSLRIVSRDEWQAQPAKHVTPMTNPVPHVIIHHSYIPPACASSTVCEECVRQMQKMHQVDRGWDDIGYSFAIGGDGRTYMGRGWSAVGAHAPTYNDKSIGICLVGDWRNTLPSPSMLEATHQLIDFGVQNGYIMDNYTLFGHRQVRNGTECPGDALFNEIATWDHWREEPPSKYYPSEEEN